MQVSQSQGNEKLKKRLKDERKNAKRQALTNAATFYYLTKQFQKAYEYCERSCRLDIEREDEGSWMVLACINFALGNTQEAVDILEGFPEPSTLFGDLALMEACLQTDSNEGCLQTIDGLIHKYPESTMLKVEKAKILFSFMEKEAPFNLVSSLPSDKSSIAGLHLKTFMVLIESNNAEEQVELVAQLLEALEHDEPGNVELLGGTIELFSSVCSREVVKLLLSHLESQLNADPSTSSGLLLQKAELHLALRELDECQKILELGVDGGNIDIVFCSAHLALLTGDLEEALNLLTYIEDRLHSDIPPYFLYLKAFFLTLQHRPTDASSLLGKALEHHLSHLPSKSRLYEYYQSLDSYRLSDMLELYWRNSGGDPLGGGEMGVEHLKRAFEAARQLADALPFQSKAQLVYAQLSYLTGQFCGAITIARNITEKIDSQCVEGYLLEANAHISNEDYIMGKRCLENCLSYNFSVRSKPEYHFLLGRIQRHQGDLDSALKSFEVAQQLASENGTVHAGDGTAILLEFCKAMAESGKVDEAVVQLEEMIAACQNEEESNSLLFTWVEIMLTLGNAEAAVDALQRVKSSSRFFVKSRKYLADIALKKFSDKHMYINCFREIVEVAPVAENYVLLGNAYLDIHMPEKALEAYEEAKPKDSHCPIELVKTMATVYIKSHQFSKALSFLREPMVQSDDAAIQLMTAEIHYRIGQHDKAIKILKDACHKMESNCVNYTTLKSVSEMKYLLAKIYLRSGADPEMINSALQQAYDHQTRVVRQSAVEYLDLVGQDRKYLGEICLSLGRWYKEHKQYEGAVRFYKEALSLMPPNNTESMKALASIFAEIGDEDQCHSMYRLLSKADHGAGTLLGQLSLKKGDFPSAVKHFTDVLDQNPKDEQALMFLFEACRFGGTLNIAEKYLEKGERDIGHQTQIYLKALLKRFIGQFRECIDLLISCKSDPHWEPLVNKTILDSVLDLSVFGGMEPRPADEESRVLYSQIIKTLKCDPAESHVYNTYGRLLACQRSDADMAIHSMNLLNRETPANLLLQAVAYLIIKQVPKAKANLKRFSQNPWTLEDAGNLEKCWLLLAEIYLNTNKSDQVKECLQRVLKHNASCLKAQELLGSVAERDHAFLEAAKFYESAWKGSRNSNLAVGYRLANCLLKAKRFTETIDLCQSLFSIQSDFPRLQKDIYEKALAQIRV